MIIRLFISISFFLLFLTACSSDSFGPDEWTQYRFNSENNPVYNESDSISLEQIYKTDNEVRATPVVVGNQLFIGNHRSGSLNAFDVSTAEQLWKKDAPNWIHSEMVYKDETVFVGYGNRYFNRNVGDPYIRGSRESGVMALDAKDGEELWNFKTQGHVMPTPVIYKNHIYVITGDRHLYAIDMETGEKEWNLDMGSYASMSAPNEHEGIFYFGGADPFKFFAVNLETKEILWETPFPDAISGLDDVPPSIYNDKYIYTTALVGDSKNPTHMMFALDINNGEIVWEEDMGSGENVDNNKSGAPVVYDDKVFVVSPVTKKFYAYDAETGELIWDYDNDYVAKAPPVANDKIVYFTDTKGHIFAFDTENGDLKGVKKVKGKLAPSGPIIMNDNLIIGSQSSEVYSLPKEEIIGENEYEEPE